MVLSLSGSMLPATRPWVVRGQYQYDKALGGEGGGNPARSSEDAYTPLLYGPPIL